MLTFDIPFLILGEPNRVPLLGQVQEVLSLVTITSTQLLASSVLPQALQLLSVKFEFSFKQKQKTLAGTESSSASIFVKDTLSMRKTS